MRISEPYAAGVPKRFVIQGNFLRVASLTGLAAGSVSVQFFRDGKLLNIDLDRVDAGDWARAPETFDAIQVTSSVAQNVELQVNRGDVGSDRVTGLVSVVDGGATRSASNMAYWAFAQQPAVAAEYSFVQLWNPAANPNNLIVNRVYLMHGTIGLVVYMRHGGGALTTLYTPGLAKMLGGTNSLAEGRVQSSAGAIGSSLVSVVIDTANEYIVNWTEPVVIRPNRGMIFQCGAPNIALNMRAEYWEQLA